MDLQERFKKASKDRDNDNVQTAIAEYHQIRSDALETNQKDLAANCLHMIGISYSHIEDYLKADDFFKKAQQEFENLGDKMKIGAVLRDRGSIAASNGDLDRAKELMEQSIYTLEQTDFPGHLGMSKVKLGIIYLKQGKENEAEVQILDGIKDIEKSDDRWFESTAYLNLAEVQKKLGKIDQAKKSLEKAVEILDQIATSDEHSRRRQKIAELKEELSSNID